MGRIGAEQCGFAGVGRAEKWHVIGLWGRFPIKNECGLVFRLENGDIGR